MTRPALGSRRILPKLAVLALVIAALGLPINSLLAFALLAASVLIVFTGTVACSATRWIGTIAVASFALATQMSQLVPRIEEGHNVFLISGPGGALEQGLPREAYRAMAERFDAAYPAERRCSPDNPYCWRPKGIPSRAFAFAADGIFDGHTYTRRVSGVDFDSAIWLRLGLVNDLSLDIITKDGDVERLLRDRRSFAMFGRWQLKLPYFVMYQFPAAFTGSDLCWRGELLWERSSEQFEKIAHKDWACRTVAAEDIGRRIFGVSIGPNAALAMRLDANANVKARAALGSATIVFSVIGIILLLVHWQIRRAVFPLMLACATFVLVILIDVTFIGGYRPFDGGDDGLIFSGFARDMLQHLAAGDIAGTLLGFEKVFYFNPGMRYFRAIEFLFFGDTFLLYLLLTLILPLIIYHTAARFTGTVWAFAFIAGFMVTPLGVLFGTSYLHYVTWAARGYADPLGAMAFLSGLILIAGPPGTRFDYRAQPAFWGALLMAVAVMLRPNLAPGAGVILGGVGLAALWLRQFVRLTSLCLGFSAILLTLWHNWYFGGALVPISANAGAPNVFMLAPLDYAVALKALVLLDWRAPILAKAVGQVLTLLSGPAGLMFAIPLHLAAYAVLLRVVFSRRFEPMLRLTALAALALVPIGLIYMVIVRYNLVMWLLMALVTMAWLKFEGLELVDRQWPGWRNRFGQSSHVLRLAGALTRLRIAAGLERPNV